EPHAFERVRLAPIDQKIHGAAHVAVLLPLRIKQRGLTRYFNVLDQGRQDGGLELAGDQRLRLFNIDQGGVHEGTVYRSRRPTRAIAATRHARGLLKSAPTVRCGLSGCTDKGRMCVSDK